MCGRACARTCHAARHFRQKAALTPAVQPCCSTVLANPKPKPGTKFSAIYDSYYTRKRETDAELARKFENEGDKQGIHGSLPGELKGTNSKHLNRLIVQKQVLPIIHNIWCCAVLCVPCSDCAHIFARSAWCLGRHWLSAYTIICFCSTAHCLHSLPRPTLLPRHSLRSKRKTGAFPKT